jgi:5-formyltetrahydrofolate cyclo-ligase
VGKGKDPGRARARATRRLRRTATIKGALRHGEVIDVDQVPKLDLILCGSVAVNLKGARIGKGGGFSDLEYALLATRVGRKRAVCAWFV